MLVVLQALDAGGKDGTIRHALSGVNPAGVAVQSFKQPSNEELAHDYLWRYEKHLPAPGKIAVFNRSHYEEVLVVRVHPELLEAQQSTAAPTATGAMCGSGALLRSTNGSATSSIMTCGSQAAVEHLQRGAARPLPAAL